MLISFLLDKKTEKNASTMICSNVNPWNVINPNAANGIAIKMHSQLVISIPRIEFNFKYVIPAITQAIQENTNCLLDNPKKIDSV